MRTISVFLNYCKKIIDFERKKAMVKKKIKPILVMLLVLIMAAAIAGCRNGNGDTDSSSQIREQSEKNLENTEQNTDDDNGKSQEKDAFDNGKILIAYFSHSGNTKKIAEEIQGITGGELFEIKTVNTYSSDYNTVLDEAKAEQDEKARPELSEKITDMEQYQTVIIGFPIWWGDMPMAVYSFLDEYDLSGKTILPFCTHGGSGLSRTDGNIQNEEKDAKVLNGLAVSDTSLDDASGDIKQWLKENGVVK